MSHIVFFRKGKVLQKQVKLESQGQGHKVKTYGTTGNITNNLNKDVTFCSNNHRQYCVLNESNNNITILEFCWVSWAINFQ